MKRLASIAISLVTVLLVSLAAETTTNYRIQKAARREQKFVVWLATPKADYVLTCHTRSVGCAIPEKSIHYTFETDGELGLFLIGPEREARAAHVFEITSVDYHAHQK
jgi:hypothetical protein